ncbi:hypothetical protein Ais01nite_74330 [Asanoa ishikariensis]|uniref:Uncharacterized protein n=1 Tax=Asanoa ishikariensis TaxID=137265 RepID=A0A1H3UTN3_9ACTN|nr:hypothetical protein [Asanoa ishikariensis]GIF69398.1 hypothetical protein Ais01nite_74330 [Asanoa ishikariensis]SDZ65195.1 hypothetical protein SAMN05421684_7957 [Asanoa ishikariensis]
MRIRAVFTVLLVAAILVIAFTLPGRVEHCDERGQVLAGLSILRQAPEGLVFSDAYVGCYRMVAYAGGRLNGVAAKDAVVAYYRRALEHDGWRIAVDAPSPSVAILWARKEILGVTAYLRLSETTASTYDMHITDGFHGRS